MTTHTYLSRMIEIDQQKLQSYRRLATEMVTDGTPTAIYLPTTPVPDTVSRCLVMDAAYNPPTRAHLSLAQHGLRASGADHILLQLSKSNVDKGIEGADLGERLYMLDALAARHPNVSVALCSHARFVDKAAALQSLSPRNTHVFAIGYDTLVRLFDPKYYTDMTSELDEVFSIAEFVVANRGNHDQNSVSDYLQRTPQADYRDRIHQVTLDGSLSNVSSSEIRSRIEAGERTNEGWLPDPIPSVIDLMGLYKQKDPA